MPLLSPPALPQDQSHNRRSCDCGGDLQQPPSPANVTEGQGTRQSIRPLPPRLVARWRRLSSERLPLSAAAPSVRHALSIPSFSFLSVSVYLLGEERAGLLAVALFRVRADPSRRCCHRTAGKSSLAVQFVDGHFVESYYPTIENTFSKAIRYKGQEYTTEIVDTAGQVRTTRLHPRAFGTPGPFGAREPIRWSDARVHASAADVSGPVFATVG